MRLELTTVTSTLSFQLSQIKIICTLLVKYSFSIKYAPNKVLRLWQKSSIVVPFFNLTKSNNIVNREQYSLNTELKGQQFEGVGYFGGATRRVCSNSLQSAFILPEINQKP